MLQQQTIGILLDYLYDKQSLFNEHFKSFVADIQTREAVNLDISLGHSSQDFEQQLLEDQQTQRFSIMIMDTN